MFFNNVNQYPFLFRDQWQQLSQLITQYDARQNVQTALADVVRYRIAGYPDLQSLAKQLPPNEAAEWSSCLPTEAMLEGAPEPLQGMGMGMEMEGPLAMSQPEVELQVTNRQNEELKQWENNLKNLADVIKNGDVATIEHIFAEMLSSETLATLASETLLGKAITAILDALGSAAEDYVIAMSRDKLSELDATAVGTICRMLVNPSDDLKRKIGVKVLFAQLRDKSPVFGAAVLLTLAMWVFIANQ